MYCIDQSLANSISEYYCSIMSYFGLSPFVGTYFDCPYDDYSLIDMDIACLDPYYLMMEIINDDNRNRNMVK
jgi:hypothetical protein